MLLGLFLTAVLAQAQDDLPAPRKISLNLSGTMLKAAAERLAKDSGYPIALGDCDPKTKVSIKVEKATFVLALEVVCRSAKAGYRWTAGGVEVINEPRMPAATAGAQLGPFTMRAWLAPWDKDNPAIWIDADWEPAAGAAWYRIQLDSVLGEKGEPLPRLKSTSLSAFYGDDTNHSKMGRLSGTDGDWKHDVFPLQPVPGKPRKLKSISGTAFFAFPVGPKKTVRFAPPADRMKVEVDGFTFTLMFLSYDDQKKIWDCSVNMDLTTAPVEKRLPLYGLLAGNRVRFFGTGGALANLELGGTGHGGNETNLRFASISGHCKVPDGSPLKAVEADFYGDVDVKPYPFEIKDVPVIATKE